MPPFYQDADLAVCAECFDDEGIKGFIEENASDCECSFCGSTSEEPIAAPIRNVTTFIEEGIRRAYGNPDECGMSWDSEDQRYYPGSTYDTQDLVGDLVDLPNDDGSLFYAICYNFDNDVWCDVNQYRLSDHEQLRYSWDHFCRVIKYERRFFFSSYYKGGRDDNEEIFSPGRLLEIIFDYAETIGLVRPLPRGTKLFRVRKLDGVSPSALNLGPPPAPKALQQNRMSPAGISMLYVSEDAETALRETVDQPGLYTVGEFATERDATIVDFSRLPRIPSLFEPIHDTMEYDPRKLLIFLHTLATEISKPIERDNRVHIEYVPTQVVTEHLRGMKTKADLRLDGIRYSSARHRGGASLVLFCDPNNITLPLEQQGQYYRLYNDRWINFVGHEDRLISPEDIAQWNKDKPEPPYRDPEDDIFREPDDDR